MLGGRGRGKGEGFRNSGRVMKSVVEDFKPSTTGVLLHM